MTREQFIKLYPESEAPLVSLEKSYGTLQAVNGFAFNDGRHIQAHRFPDSTELMFKNGDDLPSIIRLSNEALFAVSYLFRSLFTDEEQYEAYTKFCHLVGAEPISKEDYEKRD